MLIRCVLLYVSVMCGLCLTAPRNPLLLLDNEAQYAHFSEYELEEARKEAKEMFYFGWNNYMSYAFPHDELDPIHCTGRGHDHEKPDNININDVLGDYSLTLIDTLDSLVVFGDEDEFKRAVNLVINTVSFAKNTTVQVFEATIRVIGSLLSAHLVASDASRTLGEFYMPEYTGELLSLAHDLAARLMPAFDGTKTGLPYTRVNLINGVLPGTVNETCTSGAGSLLFEFGILSRLLGDDTYEKAARRINEKLWSLRDRTTGLLAYILFGDERDLEMFNDSFDIILSHMRRGRASCTRGVGEPPIFVNVDARDGSTSNTWIDALQASFAGVLVLAGDVEEAICQHGIYYAIWKKYGVLPERFNWHLKRPDVNFYPLRPEFAESTYLLYLATKNPFYLHVGREILDSINTITRVRCGFATVHDVHDGTLEDRMESFFLAETMKYLYLLFDVSNPVNVNQERLIFSTEGHIFPISDKFRQRMDEPSSDFIQRRKKVRFERINMNDLGPIQSIQSSISLNAHELTSRVSYARHTGNISCSTTPHLTRFTPPLDQEHMQQLFESVGLSAQWWS